MEEKLKADKTTTSDMQQQINNLVLGAVGDGNNAEVIQARGNEKVLNDRLNKIENLKCILKPVKSTYWGENITVAGLITSQDLINAVRDIEADYIVVPSIMLKPDSHLFLDGISMSDVIKETGKTFLENAFLICIAYSSATLAIFSYKPSVNNVSN